MSERLFWEAWAKLEHADLHISTLMTEMQRYLASEQNVHLHIASNASAVRVGAGEPPPRKIQLIVGDVLHNLRSALDILAVGIVAASGGSREKVYFPFSATAEQLDQQIKDKKFSRAKPEAIQLMKSLRPYKGGNKYLRAIHDLNISDKHVSIIQVCRELRIHHMQIGGATFVNCTFSGNFGNTPLILTSGPSAPKLPDTVEVTLTFSPGQLWPTWK